MDLGRLGRFEADFSSPTLFKRCANCDPEPPPCPVCDSDHVCSLIGGGCNSCAVTMCTEIKASPTPAASDGPSPAGPIAGGVIGGIVVICLMTFLVWRFCIKKRRQQFDENAWRETETEKGDDDSHSQRGGRASVHSVRSIASTVLTRASNVIQIAYIPGVTNRSIESTPDLIPPVPPIPAMSPVGSHAGTPHPTQDQHFFMPSDLRDSTYSDYTVDRTSYARTSMTPSVGRGSVPSTAYRGSAVVNTLPAQTAIRGKANPVAVKLNGKNSSSNTSRSATPPVPLLEKPQQDSISTNTTSPIVARSGVPKAVTVTKSNGNLAAAAAAAKSASPVSGEKSQPTITTAFDRKVSIADSRHDGTSSTFDDASSSDDDSPANQSLMGYEKLPRFSRMNDSSVKSPSSAPDLRLASSSLQSSSSPDRSSRAKKQKHKRSGSLNQIIEEATRRASKEPRHGGLGSVGSVAGNYERVLRGSVEGPFSDANAARTP
ncbi:MAG: hypothetical protein Q9164_002112 [Protoblastenia rupestris]